MGVYTNYIQLCSELLKNVNLLDNLWCLMIDSVDIQVNLTVCRSKGLIYGVSGRIYKISDVLQEQIFTNLNALEHLARSNCSSALPFFEQLSIVAACKTCVSEKNSDVAQLLRDTMNVCRENSINFTGDQFRWS